jgi:hypothetical protein
MRLQRYPDGGAHWTWFVWSRHPENSLTWTHSLTVTRWRHWSLRPRLIWDRIGAQRGYGFQWLGVSAQMTRQQPMWQNVNAR